MVDNACIRSFSQNELRGTGRYERVVSSSHKESYWTSIRRFARFQNIVIKIKAILNNRLLIDDVSSLKT